MFQPLLVGVYRTNFDCTLRGVSSKHDRVLLIGPSIPLSEVENLSNLPVLRLVRRRINNQEYLHAEPVEKTTRSRMFGGNFIFTSDGRFPNHYPIPVHDREE